MQVLPPLPTTKPPTIKGTGREFAIFPPFARAVRIPDKAAPLGVGQLPGFSYSAFTVLGLGFQPMLERTPKTTLNHGTQGN